MFLYKITTDYRALTKVDKFLTILLDFSFANIYSRVGIRHFTYGSMIITKIVQTLKIDDNNFIF